MKKNYIKKFSLVMIVFALFISWLGIAAFPQSSYATTFIEDFSTDTCKDVANTTADWDTQDGKVKLPGDWSESYDSPDQGIATFAVYNNKLYAGTFYNGIAYVHDGSSWSVSYDSPEEFIRSLAVYNNKLYAGSYPNGIIYVYDGSSWSVDYYSPEKDIVSLVVYNNKLYAGTYPNGTIYVYDGSSWSVTYDTPEEYIFSLAVYDNKLYAGTGWWNGTIYVYDGSSWSVAFDSPEGLIPSFAVYNNKLYAGSYPNGIVYVYDSSSWSVAFDSPEPQIASLAVYNNKLYAGSGWDVSGEGIIYVYDGNSWSVAYDSPEMAIYALETYNNKLYAGSFGNGIIYVNKGGNYQSSAQAQSLTVNTTAANITKATLTTNHNLNGQTINYYLSADGGENWEAVTSGEEHTFTNQGDDLRWKAILSTSNPLVSPEIDSISLDYYSYQKFIKRMAGETRYETAIEISKEGWPNGSNTVIITRGNFFTDALSGAPLAAKYNAPILLTWPSELKETVVGEIKRLQAKEAIILGSEDAIFPHIEEQLITECDISRDRITRLGGLTRYDTAGIIARELKPLSLMTAFIATGENFPDALSSSSIAAYNRIPILLVRGDIGYIPYSTREALKDLGITSTLILGQNDVVAESIEQWLKENNYQPTRLGGDTRYDTCKLIAEYGLTHLGIDVRNEYIASGENFPDALALGTLAGKNKAPILLTMTTFLPEGIKGFIDSHKDDIYEVYIAGGFDVVSDEVVSEIKTVIE